MPSEVESKEYDPDSIKTLVEVLDQNTLMRVITDELPSYTANKILSLTKLGIQSIEPVQGLEALNRLDLSYNKLKSLRALDGLKSLTWLKLDHNALSGKGIRGILLLDRIVYLNLGNNRIRVIPDFTFVKMEKLQCLLLNNNKLETIDFLSDLHELNTVALSYNNIATIQPTVFSQLSLLRKLSLGHNCLTEFPMLPNQPHLKELNLNGNKIRHIPESIKEIKYLMILDVGNNLIERMEELEVLSEMKYLKNLNVAQNPLYGDEDVNTVNQAIEKKLPGLKILNNHPRGKVVKVVMKREKKEREKEKLTEKPTEKSTEKLAEKPAEVKTSENTNNSGVVGMETAYTRKNPENSTNDVMRFLMNGNEMEEVGGWDD